MTYSPDDDWEPDAADELSDDDAQTVPCPYCHRDIYEDAPRCPHCGEYMSQEDVLPSRKPAWMILTAFVCLIVIVLWVLNR